MMEETKIMGVRIFLKKLSPEGVTQEYLGWLQDEEVIQFLESRWEKHTLESIKEYVRLINESSSDFLFGIFLKETGEHIGNIKIGCINKRHSFANLGLLIGNKKMWGKNYGTEAIKLVTSYAFAELNLNKFTAGIYANNIGSFKAFLKAGYREVGRLKKHRFYKGDYIDEILVENCKNK